MSRMHPVIPRKRRIITMLSSTFPHKSSRFVMGAILMILLFNDYGASALDLSRAFKKADKDAAAAAEVTGDGEVVMSSEDALANAKKLVNDLNDAATGTVTSYQPGHEKAPVTCNEIMAKSLVVANEEKAAISAEKDAVVKAAALLSEKIDDLTSQLETEKKEVAELKQSLDDQRKHHISAQEAQHKHSQESMAKMEQNMSALQNATADSIAKVEKETANKLAAKDEEVVTKIAEANQRIAAIEEDAQRRIREAQHNADNMLESLTVKIEEERKAIVESTQIQISNVESESQQQIEKVSSELAHTIDEYENKLVKLKIENEQSIQDMEERMKNNERSIRSELKRTVEKAESKIADEKARVKELEEKLQVKLDEAKDVQQTLKNDLELVRGNSFKLEKEVSFWKETHEQQPYCNATLIKEDSQRIVMNVLNNAALGLEHGHEAIMAGLGNQLDLLQKTGGDVMVFIEKDLLPNIERIVGETCEKALELYNQHLAETVNENIVPLYNEHIYPIYDQRVLPVYMEHVSPVVKTIEGEAAVALQKSQEGVQLARTRAASLVTEAAHDVVDIVEKKKMNEKLPNWLYRFLNEASKDGEWVVDRLSKGLLICLAILCRSLIFRIIGAVFSLLWFFCPLRIIFGGGGDGAKGGEKVPQDVKKNGSKSRSKSNGKANVY